MTAEDPVEFNLVGVNQVQVRDEHRPQLRRRAALVPAPGPEHHPGRRDPRLRDGGDRGQGRAHRPPRALDAAHQRRAEHDQPPDEHGHRAVPGGELGQPDLRPAPGAPRLRRLQGPITRRRRRRSSRPASRRRRPRQHVVPKRGTGCEQLQQHRLQGPRRPLRGHGDHRARCAS